MPPKVGRMDGDERLATRLGELLGPRHPVAAAALVSGQGVVVAGLGAGLDADFEIGSITKGVTGLLYADALARGEIGKDTTVGELLPLGDVPAARVTLRSLTTHRSGLPGLPKSAEPLRRSIALWRHGTNPYGDSLGQLLDQARGVQVGKPRPRYSNFGFELLGHALAGAASTTYADLLRQRIAEPLDLEFSVPATADQLRPGAIIGRSRLGQSREPWTGEAIGPAGGIRASITAMARFAAAVLDGRAPGIAALDPVARFGVTGHIGAAWLTSRMKGRSVTWHNGGTGGFRTWLGFDRDAGTAAVVLTATAIPVNRQGFALLPGTGS